MRSFACVSKHKRLGTKLSDVSILSSLGDICQEDLVLESFSFKKNSEEHLCSQLYGLMGISQPSAQAKCNVLFKLAENEQTKLIETSSSKINALSESGSQM